MSGMLAIYTFEDKDGNDEQVHERDRIARQLDAYAGRIADHGDGLMATFVESIARAVREDAIHEL